MNFLMEKSRLLALSVPEGKAAVGRASCWVWTQTLDDLELLHRFLTLPTSLLVRTGLASNAWKPVSGRTSTGRADRRGSCPYPGHRRLSRHLGVDTHMLRTVEGSRLPK